MLFIFSLFIAWTLACSPTEYALNSMNGSTEYDDFHLFFQENGEYRHFGVVIIPENGVDGRSYAPYAKHLGSLGHYTVLLKDGEDHERKIYNAFAEIQELVEITSWGLIGHGQGATNAAALAKADDGKRITGVLLIAGISEVDIADLKREVILIYGHSDRVVDVEPFIHSFTNYESFIIGHNANHMDFAFSTCVDEDIINESIFESGTTPVLKIPDRGIRVINNDDLLEMNNFVSICSVSDVSANGVSIDSSPFSVNVFFNKGRIVLNTHSRDYDEGLLNNKRIRLEASCSGEDITVDFYLTTTEYEPKSNAESLETSIQESLFIFAGMLAWRGPDQRARSFPADREENGYFVWEAENPERVFVFFPGGSVHAQGYAPLARLFADNGVTVIIPTPRCRLSILAASSIISIMMDPRYSHIDKWSVGGHSVGGVGAVIAYTVASFIPSIGSKLDSLVMYASLLGSEDFSTNPLPIINIYGSLDNANLHNTDYKADFGNYNPATTKFVKVEGGNHYYVGDYGDQLDNVATISKYDQQRIFMEETIKFWNEI